MKIKIYHIALLIIPFLFTSCKEDYTEGISPAERNAKNIEELRNTLTKSKYGWRMIYFSKTDSLLFTNKNAILEKMGSGSRYYRKLYGYGGYYFSLKFDKKGIVKMRADYTDKSITETKTSKFEVKQNTYTQLSFTTYNYIHQLINDKTEGACDFLYVGKNFEGDLVFKTSSYIEPAREYIVLQKLKSAASWDNNIRQSYENRKFFDNMQNPQISIKKGDRIYFKSDVVVKSDSPLEFYQRFLREIPIKRYYLFVFNTLDDPWLAENKPKSNGLGSGYVGTERGLFFYTGIRYNKKFIFYDFKRENDKFTCELVKIYDPIQKTYLYVSKHLYPKGEPTYMVAEITDEPK